MDARRRGARHGRPVVTEVGASTVRTELRSGIATIEFSVPGRSAWDPEVDPVYTLAPERVDEDAKVPVVLRRADGHFRPGRAGLRAAASPRMRRKQSHGVDRTRLQRKPVVAVVHGSCAGAGVPLALLGNVRSAATSAAVSTAFARGGLPSAHGTSCLLGQTVSQPTPPSCGCPDARLATRQTGSGGCTAASPTTSSTPWPRGAHVTSCSCSPRCIMKLQIREDQERGYADALAESLVPTDDAFDRPDFADRVASYEERRPARFHPRGAEDAS